jgi:hypothetical protein
VDKITTAQKAERGARLGRPEDQDIPRLNQAALVYPGLAESPRVRTEDVRPGGGNEKNRAAGLFLA